MTETLFDLAASREARDKGMEAAANGYGASDWLDQARKVAEILAARHGEVTADMVQAICPRPASVSPAASGSLFRGKKWRCIGFTQSSQVSRHAGAIRRWVLV